jgi:HAE1 family hydrophobic/amphiphilic exporter-1
VGQVMVLGGVKRQVNVVLDPVRLKSHGLTVNDVARSLKANNAEFPGGSVKRGEAEYTLRTLGRVDSPAEMNRIPVARRGDHTVTVGDLGVVEDGVEEQKSVTEFNGQPSVLLQIRKQSGTNTVAVAAGLKEKLEELRPTFPPGYDIRVVRDLSVFVSDSIESVKTHLIEGSIFAAIIVLLFLRNFRTTFISALAIPTSIISTFAVMWYLGFTLNMLTMLALTLSVGIVIDDAIVVLENIYRFIEEKNMKPFDAAIGATREIGLAVLSITLSLVAVFMPIAFMSGIVGRFMASFGITMSAAIIVSMLVSFTLTPMISARWLRHHPVQPGEEENGVDPARKGYYGYIERTYLAMLRWSLRHRWVVVLTSVVALASVVPMMGMLPKNFLPDEDRSEFDVTVRAPEGTTLEATAGLVRRIAADIRGFAGVGYTVAGTGTNQQGLPNDGSIYVKLMDPWKRGFTQFEMMELVRAKVLARYAKEHDLRTAAKQVDDIAAGGVNAPVMYVVRGPSMTKLGEFSDRLKSVLKEVPGTADVDSTLNLGKPQYNVIVDREKAADLGVDIADVAQTLRLLVQGEKVTDYTEKGERYEVHVRAAAERRSSKDILGLISVPSRKVGAVALADLVRFRDGTGPAEINRSNRQREVTVYCNLKTGASTQQMIDKLNEAALALNMGPEYSTGLEGQSKEMGKAMMGFVLVFFTAFIFVYLVLAAQFESWLHPVTILLTLPLTLPFALLSLLLFGQSLNIFTLLGILVLFAVVKKNSILQIDHANKLRKEEGMERTAAILQANRDRLRPILMTTAAFVAGMFPLLISSNTGAGVNKALSSVIIGGQTLSLLLTLLAVPVAYSLFDDLSMMRLWSRLGNALMFFPRLGKRLVTGMISGGR